MCTKSKKGNMMTNRTHKLTTIAMLCAVAYIVMVIGRVPVVAFLKYDPKDVIIVIGGFLMGPMAAFLISVIVSIVEMFTVSDTGIIGFFMNVLASCAFACTAAYIYKRNHTLKGALIGLVVGVISMTTIMVLWNYLITPIYLGIPREAVVKMLAPMILPFNLLKGGLNLAITLLIYRPISDALRKAGMLEAHQTKEIRKTRAGIIVIALVILVTCICSVLAWRGII